MPLRRESNFLAGKMRVGKVLISDRGPIDTPMVAKAKETSGENRLSVVPMGREGNASEVAELVCFLLCDGSSYMTGTIQSIDGGWAA